MPMDGFKRNQHLLTVPGEKIRNPVQSLAKNLFRRKEHQPEMIRVRPIETGPLNNQNSLFAQQVQDELDIIGDVESRRVKPWEEIEGPFWLHAGYTGNTGDPVVREISLIAKPASLKNQMFEKD